MSELPNGWADTKLGDLIELKYGKGLPEKSRVPGPFSVYGSNGSVGTHQTSITSGPTIIVGRKGSIGEVHFSKQPCFPIDTTYYVDRFDVCEASFAVYFLKSLRLSELNRATAIPGLNRDDAYGLEVHLPPLPEQHRIVAKIDSLSAKSKRARDQLDHIPRLLARHKQAVLAATFNDASFAQWKQGPLEHFITEAIVGLVRSKTQQSASGGIPYIRMNHFDMEGVWNNDDLSFVNVSPEELQRYELREGDVLFNTRNSFELVGKVAVWPANRPGYVYNNNLLRLRFARGVDPYFAGLLMISPAFRTYLQTVKSATTSVCAIYQRSLLEAPFAIPSLDEQHAITQAIHRAMACIDRLAAEATSARTLIDHLDQAVLAKAFRGELVPQNPNDEPARVLLERIKAGRQASSAKPAMDGMKAKQRRRKAEH
jgi:type I restriction enzyme S subunit